MIQTLYKTFQHWSQNGSIYILSDTHFDDSDTKIMDKDWITPTEQINILKKYCHKNDTLIILGDVGNPEYLKEIKSYKVLIKGNHDGGSVNYEQYFNEIYEGPLFIAEKILLSHEPIYGLDFCLNIHGHDHNKFSKKDVYHLNLAANVCGYTPISLGEIIKNGQLSKINGIHREIIDAATERKNKRVKKL